MTPTTHLISTSRPVGRIAALLAPFVASGDSFAIFTVGRPWAAHLDPTVETFALTLLGDDEEWFPPTSADQASG